MKWPLLIKHLAIAEREENKEEQTPLFLILCMSLCVLYPNIDRACINMFCHAYLYIFTCQMYILPVTCTSL